MRDADAPLQLLPLQLPPLPRARVSRPRAWIDDEQAHLRTRHLAARASRSTLLSAEPNNAQLVVSPVQRVAAGAEVAVAIPHDPLGSPDPRSAPQSPNPKPKELRESHPMLGSRPANDEELTMPPTPQKAQAAGSEERRTSSTFWSTSRTIAARASRNQRRARLRRVDARRDGADSLASSRAPRLGCSQGKAVGICSRACTPR